MSYQNIIRKALKRLLAGSVLAAFLVLPASAADVYLVAKEFTKTMPDGIGVPMWGFAVDADSDLGTFGGEIPAAPGPIISVSEIDPNLNIYVRNDLGVPISIVIPGQPAELQPQRFIDALGRSRVSAFTHETPSGSTGVYSWTGLRPGTFIYHSGSHPSVQVPMGLYGGFIKDASPGSAYVSTAKVNASYSSEVVLFLSEIDPVLNAAVSGGTYGTLAYPSTINYAPTYFLVNGEPFDSANVALSTITAGNVDERIIVRFLNAGLMSHVPTIDGMYMDIIAEDGNLYPYPKNQYSLLVAAGKTIDAVLKQKDAGFYPLYDRRLQLANASVSPGGMMNYLQITSMLGAPAAFDDSYAVSEEALLSVLSSRYLNQRHRPWSWTRLPWCW